MEPLQRERIIHIKQSSLDSVYHDELNKELRRNRFSLKTIKEKYSHNMKQAIADDLLNKAVMGEVKSLEERQRKKPSIHLQQTDYRDGVKCKIIFYIVPKLNPIAEAIRLGHN